MTEQKPLSRSEREAQLKDKSGFVIVIFAIMLALTNYFSSGNSSKILTNTIEINNTYSFYQAKDIKQRLDKMSLENAKDANKIAELKQNIARYTSEPETGEGKKELLAKAKKLEADRAQARLHSSWYTYTSMMYQIAIVFLTAAILAVNKKFYTSSLVVGILATVMLTQALWLWMPL
jgi:type IV secretory pathway VirB10-like protein